MNTLTNELIIENVVELQGWTPSECRMSGTLEWTKPDSDVVVYATPNWDTDGMTPIATLIDDEDYTHITEFKTPDLETYLNVVGMVLNSLK